MKKCLMVLTAVMLVALFVPTASASFIYCGGVGTPAGSNSFANGVIVPTASINNSTGVATMTCTGVGTVPVGSTLTGVDLYLKDSASGPPPGNAEVDITWNAGVGVAFAQEVISINSTNGIDWDLCQGKSGPFVGVCPVYLVNLTENVLQGGAIPTITALAQAGGAVPASNGNITADLYIQYDYTSNGTIPEPATLSLMGGALLGLGVFARKRFTRP
jgi:hypothetical protein